MNGDWDGLKHHFTPVESHHLIDLGSKGRFVPTNVDCNTNTHIPILACKAALLEAVNSIKRCKIAPNCMMKDINKATLIAHKLPPPKEGDRIFTTRYYDVIVFRVIGGKINVYNLKKNHHQIRITRTIFDKCFDESSGELRARGKDEDKKNTSSSFWNDRI